MLYFIEKKIIQKIMPSRQEGGPVLKLFYLEDYPDMSGEPFEFYSDENKLKGIRYHIGDGPYKGIIIFFHGMGAGHNAYENFIHSLAKQNYLVYAYDNSCCGESDGDGWWNFSSSLVDQENFFKWLEKDEAQKGYKRIAVGHSWGGFTAQNALRYNVDKIISVSGFRNPVKVLTETKPSLKIFTPLFKGGQKHYYKDKGNIDTLDILKNTDKPALLIHGSSDDVVNYKHNFLDLKEALANKNNIEFYTANDRYHQPYMSKRGEDYYRYLNESGIALGKVNPVPDIDYDLLLEEDEGVMNKIYDFINN